MDRWFGARRYPDLSAKAEALQAYIDCFERRGHSWCYWNFKDLGLRGPLYIDPDSPWCRFTEDIRALKLKYHTDRAHTDAEPWRYDQFLGGYSEGEFELSRADMAALLDRNVRETLSDQLCLTFARRFAALSLDEIGALTDSFRFENCRIYRPWADLFRRAGQA